MEVGGILLGSNTGDTVRVREALPLDISYERGAVFLLTDADYESLDRLIQKADREVARKGLRVVGYYESHTRRGAELSEADLETYDARFDQPSRVCIVLKPNNENGTIINVYIRDQRGDIVRTELEGDAVHYEETAVAEPAIAPIMQPLAPEPDPFKRPQSQAPLVPVRAPRPRRVYAIVLVAIAIGAAAILLIARISSTTSGSPPPVSNTVQQPAGPSAPASNPNATSEPAPAQNPTVSSSTTSKRSKAARNRRARNRKQTH